MKRRQFLGQTTSLLSVPVLMEQPGLNGANGDGAVTDGQADRAYWLRTLLKITEPVLSALATNTLKTTMPVESAPGQLDGRKQVSHLEALGRTLAGLAPWLETAPSPGEEAGQRRFRELSIRAISNAVDPQSPDFFELHERRATVGGCGFSGPRPVAGTHPTLGKITDANADPSD